MNRMETTLELRETIAATIPAHTHISGQPWEDCNETQRGRRRDLADAVLAALGLDDLDAAVERGAAALYALGLAQGAAANRYPLDSSTSRERLARLALEAALTATGEGD